MWEKKRQSRSRKKRRSSTSRRKSKNRKSRNRATINSLSDSPLCKSRADKEKKGEGATNGAYDVVEAGSVTEYSGTTVSVNVCKSIDRDLSARLSLSSISADDA